MAIKIYEKFAPRANPADGDYPHGSIKNESVPGAKDGTPLDAAWGNDYAGFDAALLAQAGIVPNGSADKLGASQRVDALHSVFDTYGTVATLASGKHPVGTRVALTDRVLGIFLVGSGGTADGKGVLDAGNGNTAIYQKNSEFVILEHLGAISSPSFDIVPILISAATFGNKVKAQLPLTYHLGSEYVYPRNSFEITGVEHSPYTAATTFKPMDSHAGLSLFDLNENGSGSGIDGGQYNKLVNCRVDGGMSDFKNPLDPRVNFIGVRGLNTRNETRLINVSFRNCGKPFSFSGYQHKFKNIDIYECHTGGDMESTGSSVIDGYNILTCYKNWGSLTGIEVRGAVLQQGNDLQKLVDDKGVTCTEVHFTGSFYTEGGNAQIYVTDGSWVTAQNAVFGFAILNAGGYGNYNIRVVAGSSIVVNGGKSVDTKSFLVGGGASAVAAAKNIHLDIEPNDGRLFDYVDATQLPACENLLVKRSYATIERKNGYSEITYNVYEVNISTVTVWNQVGNAVNLPHGGQIEIQCAGTNTYDKYRIDFADSTAEASQVIINTIMRNTSGTGDNNVTVTYTAPNITLQGRKNPQRFAMVVKGWGNIWPKPIQ